MAEFRLPRLPAIPASVARKGVIPAALLAALTGPLAYNTLERWEGNILIVYADKLANNIPTYCAGRTDWRAPVGAKLYRNGAQVYSGAHSGLANPAGVSFRCAVGNGLGAPGSNTGGIRAHIDELVIVKGWAGDISGITSEIVL